MSHALFKSKMSVGGLKREPIKMEFGRNEMDFIRPYESQLYFIHSAVFSFSLGAGI